LPPSPTSSTPSPPKASPKCPSKPSSPTNGARPEPLILAEENVGELFTRRPKSPDHLAKMTAVREAAVALVRAQIAEEAATVAFLDAVKHSAPDPIDAPNVLQALAAKRRAEMMKKISGWSQPEHPTRNADGILNVVETVEGLLVIEAAPW
jgi:hypothetical protein